MPHITIGKEDLYLYIVINSLKSKIQFINVIHITYILQTGLELFKRDL